MSIVSFLFGLLLVSRCAGQIAKKNTTTPQPADFELFASSRCCQLTDEEDPFMECLKEAIDETKESILLDLKSTYGPKRGVGIVTQIPENTLDRAFGIGIKQAAETNGYFLDIFEPKGTGSVSWEKISYLRAALDDVDGWARDVDYLVWINDNIIIVDMGLRIESIFSKYKKASMIISEGLHDAKIATSFFILRNNDRTLEFLDDWLRQGRGLEMSFEEADSYQKLIDGDEAEYESIVKVLPADSLNTAYPASSTFKPHNQVLNLEDEHHMFRKRAFSEGYHGICRADSGLKLSPDSSTKQLLPRQLDLNAGNLSSWGVLVYGKMFDERLSEYGQNSREGLNNATVTGELAFHLRNVARLLEGNDRAETAQRFREMAFKEMYMNFKKRRVLNSEQKESSGEFMPDWLEFMDHITLVGSEYAQKIDDYDERRVVMKVMLELANELDTLDSERSSVQERLMNIHMDLGMIAAKSNENEDSTKHFVEAVRIGRVLLSNRVITEGAMFFPLSFCGDAFMKQSRYKEALVMYGYALDIGKKSLAAGDIMYPTMVLQYGIACYYDKRYRTSVTKIEEGLDFFAQMEDEMDDDTFYVVEQALNVLDAAKKAKYDPKVFDDDLRNEF